MIAYLNLDEVIKIIRNEDEPKPVLMKRFKLTEIQVEAILETKLRNLAKLEEMKIKGEQDELEQERDILEKTLKSAARLKTLIKKEILEDAEAYGDERRTEIVASRQDLTVADLITEEDMVVTISHGGYAKTQPITDYQAQRRGGKG